MTLVFFSTTETLCFLFLPFHNKKSIASKNFFSLTMAKFKDLPLTTTKQNFARIWRGHVIKLNLLSTNSRAF